MLSENRLLLFVLCLNSGSIFLGLVFIVCLCNKNCYCIFRIYQIIYIFFIFYITTFCYERGVLLYFSWIIFWIPFLFLVNIIWFSLIFPQVFFFCVILPANSCWLFLKNNNSLNYVEIFMIIFAQKFFFTLSIFFTLFQ